MFLAVVEQGGYLEAGEHLHVSHSAIHRQVKMLEDEIKDRLFHRIGRRVEPTEVGQTLAAAARQLRHAVSDAKLHIDEARQGLRGRLRIGTGSSILASFLAPIIEQFGKQYPEVELHVTTGTAARVMEALERGELDVAIAFDSPATRHRDQRFLHETLYREEFVWAVGKGHPLAACDTISLAELAKFPFILLPRGSTIRRIFDRLFEARGLAPKVLMEIETEEAIEKLVEINLGVTLRSKWRGTGHNLHALRTSRQNLYCEVGLVYPRAYVPKTVSTFAQLCRDACHNAS
jgi:DNA-binding transcriptional LysR family regulator